MRNLLFALLVCSSVTAAADRGGLSGQCLTEAKSWIYANTPANPSQAGEASLDFCSRGGRVTCLKPAKDWIYANTPANPSQAGELAIDFCKGGDVACLKPTKDWVYANTPANPSQAAERAIQTCGRSNRDRCQALFR